MDDLANCIRFLTVDAVLRANSGHVGMCLGLADVMTVLFLSELRHDPKHPDWPNRDRVVLSNGHGSMLLYSALYLSGYDWTIDELKQFRQLGSHAAGHPEYNIEKGVEVTTGPLGQGFANALGMAVAKERLNYLHPGEFNYTTYCFVGDGCLMEGISHEVGALAPKLVQSGFVVIWDDNGISIDGKIDPWFESNVLERFKSYGFEVIEGVDGHDFTEIQTALRQAKKANKPCFIQMKTVIGKGCQAIEGMPKAHGQPLTTDSVSKMRVDLSWPYQPFEIPDELRKKWRVNEYKGIDGPPLQMAVPLFEDIVQTAPLSTRQASFLVLQSLVKSCPYLIGGSADLSDSNLTKVLDGVVNDHCFDQQYIAYGVREFAMFAIANGLALSGLTPYVGTFLTFMDYGKNALRMSALMRLKVIYVLTHDSIALGEDGPTHQPVEQLLTCRAIPNVMVWRPCNLAETKVAWREALRYQGPTVLALSRQSIPLVPEHSAEEIKQGAYIVFRAKSPEGVILASGSEVPLAIEIAQQISMDIEVVSVPCLDRWSANSIQGVIRVERSKCFVIEAGSSLGWGHYAPHDQIFGVDQFGVSAKAEDVYQAMGLTVNNIVAVIECVLGGHRS